MTRDDAMSLSYRQMSVRLGRVWVWFESALGLVVEQHRGMAR